MSRYLNVHCAFEDAWVKNSRLSSYMILFRPILSIELVLKKKDVFIEIIICDSVFQARLVAIYSRYRSVKRVFYCSRAYSIIVVQDIDSIARTNECAIRIKMSYVHFRYVLHAYN